MTAIGEGFRLRYERNTVNRVYAVCVEVASESRANTLLNEAINAAVIEGNDCDRVLLSEWKSV